MTFRWICPEKTPKLALLAKLGSVKKIKSGIFFAEIQKK